eukprot:m.36647 g.36647  ORF g.36647 m.36647 type:complete len:388 (+) comp5401_c0_seq4:1504-2667(+)
MRVGANYPMENVFCTSIIQHRTGRTHIHRRNSNIIVAVHREHSPACGRGPRGRLGRRLGGDIAGGWCILVVVIVQHHVVLAVRCSLPPGGLLRDRLLRLLRLLRLHSLLRGRRRLGLGQRGCDDGRRLRLDLVVLALLPPRARLGPHLGGLGRCRVVLSPHGVLLGNLALKLRERALHLRARKLLCLAENVRKTGIDVRIAKLVLEAGKILRQLLDALVRVRDLAEAERKVPPLLHVGRRAEAVAQLLDEALTLLLLLDEGEQMCHDVLELFGVHARRRLRDLADDVGQHVVDCVRLAGQLVEEQACEVRDAVVAVLKANGHLADLALDLDHVVEDQMRQHHQRVLAHARVLVAQHCIELRRPRLDDIREAKGKITHADDGVRPDSR